MLSRTFSLALALTALAAGCVSAPPEGDLTTASTRPDAALAPGAPSTEEIDGDILLSIATPVRTINNGGAFVNLFEVEENTTGFVFEVEWSAATPASEQLSVWVRPSGVGNVPPQDPTDLVMTSPPLGKVDGASPLRLAMPFDAFGETGEYEIVVRASAQPVGAAAQQPFTLHLTTFTDIPFDDAFSALAAPEEGA